MFFLTGIVSDMDEMDYGFEYSDEDLDEEDVAIENQYYNSKGAKYIESFQFLIFLNCNDFLFIPE